jgi:hypothetical protein
VSAARFLLALCAAAAGPACAASGWSLSADVEHFRWREAGSPSVTESGPRYGLSWAYARERPLGWQWAYRGEFRRGTVDYDGALLFSDVPATARTRYTGVVNEAQGIYRFAEPAGVELLAGLGWDYWERKILPDQPEDYSVVFLRLGVNIDPRTNSGWFGGAGLKRPLYVSENAHLDEIGFDQNPRLEPKGEFSIYVQAGYHLTPNVSLIGYYDSYRFRDSADVRVTSEGSTFFLFQPASNVDTFGLKLRYSFQ